jgi:hypothetical protein
MDIDWSVSDDNVTTRWTAEQPEFDSRCTAYDFPSICSVQ